MLIKNDFRKPHCYVIGEGNIVLQCVQILLEKGYIVLGVISIQQELGEWLANKNVPFYCQLDHKNLDDSIINLLKNNPYDYLFSIVNNIILPIEVLNNARKYSINYHDALLPKYAGVNATSWAIMNGEKEHGITWHIMNNSVDSGDILKQIRFPVDKNETALTLNGKCYEAAIKGFSELVEEITEENLLPIKQDQNNRSYFSRNKKPNYNAFISWNDDAAMINALVNSLYYGNYQNNLSIPKIIVGGDIFFVLKTKQTTKISRETPGIIANIKKNRLEITTKTYNLAIEEILSCTGEELAIDSLVKMLNLKIGDKLGQYDDFSLDKINKITLEVAKYEKIWLEKLTNIKPIEAPISRNTNTVIDKKHRVVDLGILKNYIYKMHFLNSDLESGELLSALFIMFLARYKNVYEFNMSYSDSFLKDYSRGVEKIFSDTIILSINLTSSKSLLSCLQEIIAEIRLTSSLKTFSCDLSVRHSQVTGASKIKNLHTLLVNIEVLNEVNEDNLVCDDKFKILIDKSACKAFFSYDENKFHGGDISHFQKLFYDFMDYFIAKYLEPLASFELVSTEEREKILIQWNATETDYPTHKTLPQLIEEQVEKTPHGIALEFNNRIMSFSELNNRANQLANHLRHLGVKAESKVGVCMERSFEMVIALLGILKAGGCYVPIDPEHPLERNYFILKDAQISILLAQADLIELPKQKNINVLNLSLDHTIFSQENSSHLSSEIKLNDTAYIIYTSGSTGNPKGVLISHAGILNRLQWMQEVFQLTSQDAVLQKTPYSFDVSVWEFFWPLMTGARLVLAKPGGHRDNDYLASIICSKKISTIHFVPSMLNMFLEENSAIACGAYLRNVVCSGEALSTSTQNRFLEKFKTFPIELYNLYGPTEASIDVTYWRCRKNNNISVPIGHPIANTKLYILDDKLKPVPVGTAGLLYLSGVGLAKGYLNLPELTANRFIENPFDRQAPYSRIYNTGDLARYLADGSVEYLGRVDHQVKIRGFRIELGEIEAQMQLHSAIFEAVVIAHKTDKEDYELVGYYTVADGKKDPEVSEITSYLNSKLPRYMVPNKIVRLAMMPLSANGKVNRKALPSPNLFLLNVTKSYLPRNREARILASIWKEVLGISHINKADDFFDLGGHSLKAMQVIARVRKMLNVEVSIKSLFAKSNFYEFVREINDLKKKNLQLEKDWLVHVNGDQGIPLSYTQRRIWFLEQHVVSNHVYNIASLLEIEGFLDTDKLKDAVEIIAQRHDNLRMSIKKFQGEPIQKISDKLKLEYEVMDLSLINNDIANKIVDDHIYRLVRKKYDFENGPLWRMKTFKLTNKQYKLLINFHHIICDGWSIKIFMDELVDCYRQLMEDKSIKFNSLSYNYKDYSYSQLQLADSASWTAKRRFWQDYLKGDLQNLNLPTDFQRKPQNSFNGNSIYFTITGTLYKKIKNITEKYDTTLFNVLMTSYNIFLYRYTQQKNIIVGTTVANRSHSELESIIGFFANTLVFKTSIDGDKIFSDILTKMHQESLEIFSNQDIPFESILEAISADRDFSYSSLFQTMFVLQNNQKADFKVSGIKAKWLPINQETAKFDLSLFAEENEGALRFEFEYSSDLFEKATIQRMSNHFIAILKHVVDEPCAKISSIPLLNKQEQKYLKEVNATATHHSYNHCLHNLINDQAKERPNSLAIVSADKVLTYEEVLAYANRIAHRLITLGAKPNQLVAIVMEKGWEQVVAALAILKSGAAYMPIAASDPDVRIGELIQQGLVNIILTQSQFTQRLERLSKATILAVDVEDDWSDIPSNEPTVTQNHDNLAYVIFTSGSTGKPKGVMITHASAANTILDINRRFAINQNDKILGLSALNFDLSVYDIFGTLAAGATLILPHEKGKNDPAEWFELCQKYEITIWNSVPQLMQMMIDHLFYSGLKLVKNVLRVVLLSGDWIPLELPAKIHQFFGEEASINSLGGATEASIWSILYPIHDVSSTWKSIPYGKPLANQAFYIFDEMLQPVPIGVVGELYVGGAGLAQGYWKDAIKTNTQFILHPINKERLYRTGDMGKYLADGNIQFLGRIDHQVKIRGFRIELEEIQSVIKQYPGIEQAIIFPENHDGQNIMIGYCVNNAPISEFELIEYLKSRLPAYMIPARFHFLEKIPLTDNGKIDHKRLTHGFNEIDNEKNSNHKTESQEKLINIFSDILPVKKISLRDNYFRLGGNSISAIRILARIKDTFGVNISMKDFFQSQDLGSLANEIENKLNPSEAEGRFMMEVF